MARGKSSRTTYVTLQDEYGRMERYLPLHEFQGLKARPEYKRISAHLFRKIKAVEPSDSRPDPAELTLGDIEFYVSFRGIPTATKENHSIVERLERRVERLQGHMSRHRFRAA